MTGHDKLSAADFISSLLIRFRIPLLVVSVLLVAVLIGIAVGAVVTAKAANANAAIAEKILDAYSAYTGAEDKQKAEEDLKNAIAEGKAESKGSYAYVRAVLCESQMYETDNKKEEALASLADLKNLKSDLYLISIGLHRAAVLSEELGDREEALNYYRLIEKTYSDSYFNMDRIYFNIGRIEEGLGNRLSAEHAYSQLIQEASSEDRSSESPLVSVAKDRLIYLQASIQSDEEVKE